MSSPVKTSGTGNRLQSEGSPYLLQHAGNPVDWYPWGEEAFAAARDRDLPIFLSIGYATCHWCHVMERESFEDPAIAAQLNRDFVAIKVDREERPDVDALYMTAAQMLTGQGGWPLSVWLTPEGLPFYAGTYFPPTARYGRAGFPQVLEALFKAWMDDRPRVLRSATSISDAIRRGSAPSDKENQTIAIGTSTDGSADEISEEVADFRSKVLTYLRESFDAEHGGFGGAPKFPRPSLFFYLLDHLEEELGTDDATDPTPVRMLSHSLRSIGNGGIHDHIGGGYSRYAVDRQWLVPHFEKMLYDQAQLLESIARACWITPDDHYIERIFSTIFYLDDRLAAPNGGYYAAEDADSEGEEGKFYVWRPDEIRAVLDGVEADLVLERYGVTEDGNFEDRRTVLSISRSIDDLGSSHGLTTLQVRDLLESARTKLYTEREERIRPIRDEKIVSAWNGLLLSGLAHATRTTGDPAILDRATNLAAFIDGNLIDRTNVVRHIIGGLRGPSGVLEDYAFLARGFLDLYNVTIETAYLRQACALVNSAIDRFADDEGGGFFLSDGQDPLLPLRTKGDHDGAEPSGNSIMAIVLLRLYRLLGIDEYRSRAERTWRLFARRVADVPHAMPMMAIAGRLVVSAPESIVIVADDSETGSTTMLAELQRDKQSYGKVILLTSDENGAWLRSISPHLAGMTTIEGAATLYHCRNFTCERPRTSVKDGAE